MSRNWDVIVAGAGPAGSLVARQLAQRGLAVLLVDKASFPRAKVCGTCLNQHALTVLERVGLGQFVQEQGAIPLTSFDVRGWGRVAQLHLPAGLSLSRDRLDIGLIQAAQRAGAEFRPRVRARLGERFGHEREIVLTPIGSHEAEHHRASIIVDATGLGGLDAPEFSQRLAPAARIGLGATSQASAGYPFGVIHMAIAEGGYLGMVRQEDGRLNLAAAIDATYLRSRGSPAEAARDLLIEAGYPVPEDILDIHWQGTPPLTRSVTPKAAGRVFRLGDAAGYVEPFTGEGMAWALCGAVALAPIVQQAIGQDSRAMERMWARVHQRTIRNRQTVCRLLVATLRRPFCARWLLRILQSFPMLARPFVQHLNARPRWPTEGVR